MLNIEKERRREGGGISWICSFLLCHKSSSTFWGPEGAQLRTRCIFFLVDVWSQHSPMLQGITGFRNHEFGNLSKTDEELRPTNKVKMREWQDELRLSDVEVHTLVTQRGRSALQVFSFRFCVFFLKLHCFNLFVLFRLFLLFFQVCTSASDWHYLHLAGPTWQPRVGHDPTVAQKVLRVY